MIWTLLFFISFPQASPNESDEDNSILFSDNTVNSGLKNGRIFKGSHIGDDSGGGNDCRRIAFSVQIIIMLLPGSLFLGKLLDLLSSMLSKHHVIVS